MASHFTNLGQGTRTIQARAELDAGDSGKFEIAQVATIGRAPESDVVLDVRSVSRAHARIFYEGGHYWIKDLGSANGTTVNGKKITLQMLADRDKIGFGDLETVFHTSAGSARPAALAQDPLAGLEQAFADGTPTSGLSDISARDAGPAAAPKTAALQGSTEVQALTRKIESLEAENESLRRELLQYRTASAGATNTPHGADAEEAGRLRTLVTRLERALADSNQRLKNLQQLLDSKNK
jgi:predicted component of type VI protein secretion system